MTDNEMMPSKIEHPPSAPKFLSAGAKKEWKLVCRELISLGMLTAVDLGLLAAYCNEMASYIEASQKLADPEIGYVMKIDRDDGTVYYQQSPWVSIKNAALKNAQTLANQFGFTPAARARIGVPDRGDDPLAEAMKKLKGLNG